MAIVFFGFGIAHAGGGGLTESKDTVRLAYPNHETATAKCKGGTHIGFGGYKFDNKATGVSPATYAYTAAPGKKADSWEVSGLNRTVAAEGKLTSLAYCAKGPKPKIVKETTEADPSAEIPTLVSASCPQGKTLIGGGWSAEDPPNAQGSIFPTVIERVAGEEAIDIGLYNVFNSAVDVTAYAVCGKGKSPKPVEKTEFIEQIDQESAVSNCPNGKDVVFAGLRAEFEESAAALVNGFERPKDDQVKVTAINPGSAGSDETATITSIAYCG